MFLTMPCYFQLTSKNSKCGFHIKEFETLSHWIKHKYPLPLTIRYKKFAERPSLRLEDRNNSVSSVMEFQRWWVLKSKIFAQKSTCSKKKKSKNSANE